MHNVRPHVHSTMAHGTQLSGPVSAHSSQWERDQSCLHVQLTFQFSMVYGEPPTDRGSDSIASQSDPWSLFSLQTAIRWVSTRDSRHEGGAIVWVCERLNSCS